MKVVVVVREPGRLKPDYSLEFDLPSLPREGDYISIQRPDTPRPYGEDMIVRKVWWRLWNPVTAPYVSGDSTSSELGGVTEIFVECDPAIGPYSSDRWRDSLQGRSERGEIETLQVSRS